MLRGEWKCEQSRKNIAAIGGETGMAAQKKSENPLLENLSKLERSNACLACPRKKEPTATPKSRRTYEIREKVGGRKPINNSVRKRTLLRNFRPSRERRKRESAAD